MKITQKTLKNKMNKVLVTGASRGIGMAIAISLKEKGYEVIGTSTSEAGAKLLQREGITGLVLDLNNLDSIDDFWLKISIDHSDLSILINNAGITRDNLVLRMTEEDWIEVMNVHLNGMFRLSKRAVKLMLKQKWGRIINITSASAALGNKGQSNYAAAKAGVEAFSRSLAKEVGQRNITVNSVAPGFINTDMTALNKNINKEELMNSIPLGRFGDPKEVAHLISFLCSQESSYITGQTIHINGGLFM
jgi:3-oxoacyl-[acyl-carrier protein] reductase|tara:strand:- start:378 stop:1121 length:744 start_codon:yes stop_codon:yes gene_type:complete